MKFKFKTLVATALVLLTVISVFSCKKNAVKKVAVDTQFAVALFSDTVSLMQIITDMDSTTKTWLRVRNDSIFAYYVDTIRDVLKASDLLNNIEDMESTTSTNFSMPAYDPTNNHDTVIIVDEFLTVPFHYDGYNIKEVLLRSGELRLNFHVTPTIEHLQKLEIFSNQIMTPEGDTLKLTVDNDHADRTLDLSNYIVIPENDTVALGARVYLHVDSGVYPGGEYESDLEYSLKNINFKTIYGTIDKPFETIYDDQTAIDFGINGLTGSAVLPVPIINYDFCNTFGLGAVGDVTKLQFVNGSTGLVTSLLAGDMVEVEVTPTQGGWNHSQITGFTETIDALAGYTRLDFGGVVYMGLNDHDFSISDTSTVDIAANIEMPFSFKISDLCYNDTIDVNFSDASSTADEIDDYIDEIDFYVDYNNKIKLDVVMQGIFMKNGVVLDSLFIEDSKLKYTTDGEIRHLPEVAVTGRKLKNVLRSNQMILRLGVSTDEISDDPVMLMDYDAVYLRLRIHTKSSEIDLN